MSDDSPQTDDLQKRVNRARTQSAVLTAIGALAAGIAAVVFVPTAIPVLTALMVIGAAGAGALAVNVASNQLLMKPLREETQKFQQAWIESEKLQNIQDKAKFVARPAPKINADQSQYVDAAITKAQQYIADNASSVSEPGGRLAGKDAQETAEIKTFLESHPYDNATIREVVGKILADATENVVPAEGKRAITYLSGPIGSKNMLMGAVADTSINTPEFNELREALQNSVKSDFQQHKQQFSKYSGQPVEPYAKWRGLLSGIDQTLVDIARDRNLNVAIDSTMVPTSEAEETQIINVLEKSKESGNPALFAVALTPEEARAEAKKQNISETEAETTARQFPAFFAQICEHVPDVTLLDKNLNVLYKQKNSQLVEFKANEIVAWIKQSLRPEASIAQTPAVASR